MCGRFYRKLVPWADYGAEINLIPPPGIEPPVAHFNIAPGTLAPVIISARTPGTYAMAAMLWGLIPSWWHKPLSEKKFASFNAKAETVTQKPVFRGAFRHHRCLVPVSGFYEWTGTKGTRTPFAISLKGRDWFCLAGLWDTAMIDGSEIDSFTILTTQPNDLMAGLHTRMPVILKPDQYQRWLDPMSGGVDDLLVPYPADEMQAWPVDSAVGNTRNNYEELTRPA